MIPKDYIPKIVKDLGKAPDEKVAKKWRQIIKEETGTDFKIERANIYFLRKNRGIQANRSRSKPKFQGRVEDAYPEIVKMLGKLPIAYIAKYFNISRKAVTNAEERLGITRDSMYKDIAESLLKK